MKQIVLAIAVIILAAGCATTDSTARQLDRQIKLVEALQKANEAAKDAVQETSEHLEKAKADLEALKAARTVVSIEEAAEGVPLESAE